MQPGAQGRVGVLADQVDGVPPGDGVRVGRDLVVGIGDLAVVDDPHVGYDLPPGGFVADGRVEFAAHTDLLAMRGGREGGIVHDLRVVRGKPGRPLGVCEVEADLAAPL